MFVLASTDTVSYMTVWAAIVSALGALVVAAIAYISSRKNTTAQAEAQKQLALLQMEFDKQKLALEDRIAQATAERNAKRDYEYEARKRLYKECAPILFSFFELSEGAYKRIRSLARTCRLGDLPGWTSEGYYLQSTVFKLLAPFAMYRLLQQKLTAIDLALDSEIATTYELMKETLGLFKADFLAASADPKVAYDPHKGTSVHQGMVVGLLDTAIDAMVVKAEQRCISYGEYEAKLLSDPEFQRALSPMIELFRYFHPKTHPVLWRILLAQMILYDLLFTKPECVPDLAVLGVETNRFKVFDWRTDSSDPACGSIEQDVATAREVIGLSFERSRVSVGRRRESPAKPQGAASVGG
jgi:hypothetical protein